MFIEVITKSKERLSLNISRITSVISYKKGTMIFDSAGVGYELDEPYENVIERIFALISPNSETEN